MSKVEKAVQLAEQIAENPRFGYDQINRWGDDFDCSSLVIHVFEESGIPVKSKGATYTGNMHSAFKKCGFVEVDKAHLQRGDVLLNKKHHTAIYIGDGKIVHASINEKGTTSGGKKGDQTGKEICIRDYYEPTYKDGKNGWDVVLRYPEEEEAQNTHESAPISAPSTSEGKTYTVKKGDTLSKIAAKFGVSVSQLVKWNGIQNPDIIQIGQQIAIKDVPETSPAYWVGKVATKALPLNIRKGAGMNYPVVGSLPRGSSVKIAYETAGWLKLYGREGFVASQLVTKV